MCGRGMRRSYPEAAKRRADDAAPAKRDASVPLPETTISANSRIAAQVGYGSEPAFSRG
ncbi:hypothetical protein GLA29479_3505 [Lysobacter antibioticus]|nr:hypothetical protein GLA29479_3505 [Lysobacter antibioticus]